MIKRLKALARSRLRSVALRIALLWWVVGLAAAFLWDRYLNPLEQGRWHDALAIIGLLYAAVAWFNYLALDGFSPLGSIKLRNRQKSRSDRRGGMLEHIDEPPDGEGMDADDRRICCFAAFLCLGVLLQLPSIVVTLLR